MKVYATVPKKGIKQVDFLSGIVGLDTQKLRERASQLVLADGVVVHVLRAGKNALDFHIALRIWASEFGIAAADGMVCAALTKFTTCSPNRQPGAACVPSAMVINFIRYFPVATFEG